MRGRALDMARNTRRGHNAPAASSRPARLSIESLEPRLALTVVISEFLAVNQTGLADFAGDTPDWIELRNTGPAAVDVSGWYLTDDATDPTRWQIPATPATTSLAAGDYLVVFASDKNGTFGDELHANFQLAAAGDDVVLIEGDGTTIASAVLDYPQQYADVSYGTGADRGATVAEAIIGDQADATVLPYNGPNAAVDDHWREIGYNDSGWIATKTGVGYDRDDNALDGLIFQELTTGQMNFTGSSGQIAAYVRVPFTVNNKEQLTSLTAELRYDDGYILYLNDREVQRVNVNTTLKPGDTAELNARGNRPDAEVISTPDVIDLTAWLDLLEEGDNVLAVYGANHSSSSQRDDFLVAPLLTAERATGSVAGLYLTAPTPGRENGAGWLGLVGDTQFDVHRGFYDMPQSVTITTPDVPDATIRYTTDGTIPTATHGTIYTGPVSVTTTTTLRAAAFKPGYQPTNVDTQTYVFLADVLTQDDSGLPAYTDWGQPADWAMDASIVSTVGATQLTSDMQALPSVSLVMNWQDLFGDGTAHGIYTETTSWKYKSDERPTSIEFFTADGLEQFQADASVEVQGHSSTRRWNSDKLSLQVKFKKQYGEGELDAPALFANSAVPGASQANSFDTLILDAQYNYTWLHANVQQNGVAKYINDQAVADLQNLSGGYAPHGRWVNLYINGLYWGIYNLHERPDDSFAQEYFGGDEDDYYAVKAADGLSTHPEEYDNVDGGLTAEAAYAALLDEVDDAVANLAEFQQVEALLDVDDFINYMIVHYYAGNWDWGQDNWYATINHADAAGRWRFHSWDQEHAWPTADNQPLGENNFNVTYNSTAKDDQYGPTGIHRQLMDSPEYQLRFADRVQELMQTDGLLTPAAAASVFQLRIDELDRAINGEAARWGDDRVSTAYDRDDWLANVNGVLDDFFPVRTTIVLGQFASNGWLADLTAPTFSQYGGEIDGSLDLTLGNPNAGGTIYYTLDGTDPRSVGGGVAAGAVAYTGDITLSAATEVQARVFDGSDWSAVSSESFLLTDSFPLRIVELNYHPVENELTEFIELLNTGAETISLDGVRIDGFSNDGYAFASGQTLPAGERIVVARNPSDFIAMYGAGINLATGPGYAEANLSNGGETITLLGPLGELLQSFTYDDVAPWPTEPDGGGSSLEYVGPLYAGEDPIDVAPDDPFDDPANWRASLVAGGTPGTGDSVGDPSADFNGDMLVDGSDFLTWQRGFGAPGGTLATGDADLDGDVDADDLDVWQTQYGSAAAASVQVATSSTALVQAAATSEPASVLGDASNVWLAAPTSAATVHAASSAPAASRQQTPGVRQSRDAAFASLGVDDGAAGQHFATTGPEGRRVWAASQSSDVDIAEAALSTIDETQLRAFRVGRRGSLLG